MPETPRSAGQDAATGVACGSGQRYHPERGCVVRGFGEPLTVSNRNEMGDSFVLIGAAFALDGELVFDANAPEVLERHQFPVLTDKVSPGEHELGVRLFLRGQGHGVFSYLSGYRFRVESRHRFMVPVGGRTSVAAVGYERGVVTTELSERPAIRFEVRHERR